MLLNQFSDFTVKFLNSMVLTVTLKVASLSGLDRVSAVR
jgi:hypothetical protein